MTWARPACATCDTTSLLSLESGRDLLGIGYCCGRCARLLSEPTLLSGCVSGPSQAELASLEHDEYRARKARRLAAARHVCEGG